MKKLHFVLVLTLLLPFCTLGNESSVDESSSNISADEESASSSDSSEKDTKTEDSQSKPDGEE